MSVSFDNIPSDWKVPLYWIEVDPSQAGLGRSRKPVLLVGHKNNAGSGVVNVPVPVGSLDQIRKLGGEGSMLDGMARAFFRNNFSQELWILPIAEVSAGVAATGTIVVASAPTAAGTVYFYIGGRKIPLGIAADDTVDEVGNALAAAINGDPLCYVTASFNSGSDTVTLTAKWKGATGLDIDVRVNYGGALAGETLPAGLAFTIASAKLTGGTGVPDFDAAIAAMGERPFEYVAMPFTDSTSLLDWDTEYGFSDNGRWGWMRQLYGHIFSAHRATYTNQILWGVSFNYASTSTLAIEQNSPTPVWEWASAYASKSGRALSNDPARPLQTLTLDGCLSAPVTELYTLAELNSIAGVGLATQITNDFGVSQIAREQTMYQKNKYDQSDDAYELVTTLATLAELFRRQRQVITSKFARHKLANDGTRLGPGQAVVTPNIVRAELIAQYRLDEYDGLVEDVTSFKSHLIVQRDSNNPNRLNILYPPDLINQLRMFAVLGQFRLQYSRGVDVEIQKGSSLSL